MVEPGNESGGLGPGVVGAHGGLVDREALLLRSLVKSVRDYAILMLDVSGHIVTWNEGAQQLKGWTAEEIVGRHFSAFYPPEVDPAWLVHELRTAARDGRFEEEGWRVRKDGSRFWASVVITAVRDPAGKLLGFGKATRDLSDRHAAELVLRESEERFRSVTESAVDAIVSADESWEITTWNPGTARLFGYPAAEAAGGSMRVDGKSHFCAIMRDAPSANGRGRAPAPGRSRFADRAVQPATSSASGSSRPSASRPSWWLGRSSKRSARVG